MAETRPFPAPSRLASAAPWVLGAIAAATLVYFQLGTSLALNDDWMYAWSVRRLLGGHGIQLVPDQAPLALVHVVVGAALTLGHPDPRLLRLTILPFAFAVTYCVYRLSLDSGADRFWSAVAAVSALAAPIFLALATTFMSDVPYTALVLAAVLAGHRWTTRGTAWVPFIVLSSLAFLERQQALMLAPAITVVILAQARANHGISVRDRWRLVALWLVTASVVLAASLTGWNSDGGTRVVSMLKHPMVERLLGGVVYFPMMLGLFGLPFVLALVRGGSGAGAAGTKGPPGGAWLRRSTFALVCMPAVAAAFLASHGLNGFPNDYLNPSGLNPPHVAGNKVALFPPIGYLALEIAAVLGGAIIVFGNRSRWTARNLRTGDIFLLVAAALQLVPFIETNTVDRYYLPVILPLLPLLARAASASPSGRSVGARGFALAAIAAGVAIYVAGEQDYQAWQVARDSAAHMAFARVAPTQVQAGFEANAVYVELPGYERNGLPHRQSTIEGGDIPSMAGPAHPQLTLTFAGPDDPRPGVVYRSLASGKIVIVGGDQAATIQPRR